MYLKIVIYLRKLLGLRSSEIHDNEKKFLTVMANKFHQYQHNEQSPLSHLNSLNTSLKEKSLLLLI